MNKCLVSVIMITYNHSEFIEKAIESVLIQKTNFKFELIIANDKSPDDTALIINRIIKSHSKASIIKLLDNKKNLGASANFINAHNHSNSKYIAVCEGDDFWGDELKLQKQVDFLEKKPEYVLTYHDVIRIDENDFIIKNNKIGKLPKALSQLELQRGRHPLVLSICYLKPSIELPNEMASVINGDTFLASFLGNFGKGKWLNVKPAYHRHHKGGIWSLQQKNYKLKAKIHLFAVLKLYYKNQKLPDLEAYFHNQILLHNRMLLSYYVKQKKYISFLKHFFKKYIFINKN